MVDFLLKNQYFAQNQLILWSDLKDFFPAESSSKTGAGNDNQVNIFLIAQRVPKIYTKNECFLKNTKIAFIASFCR